MAAGIYNFTIEQGVTFRRVWTVYDENGDPIDLTGFTARMQIRPEVESATVMVALTTSNGGLTLGGDSGEIEVYMSDTTTSSVETEGYYDLEIISPSPDFEVTRVLKGKVRLDAEVTRA